MLPFIKEAADQWENLTKDDLKFPKIMVQEQNRSA